MTKEQLRKTIGENIRNERSARNMSIDELAELLELTSGFVGLIERGRRGATAYNIHKLAEIFGIGVENLFLIHSTKVKEDTPPKNKRRRLMSLSYDLTDKELDFVIQMVKKLRQLRETQHDMVLDNDSDSDSEIE